MGRDGKLDLEEDKPWSNQPHLRPFNVPSWSYRETPLGWRGCDCGGCLSLGSGPREQLCWGGHQAQSYGGEGPGGKLWGWGGGAGVLAHPSHHQQLFLSAGSKGGAANWRHICATCGNGSCWQSLVAREPPWHQLNMQASCFKSGHLGKTWGLPSPHPQHRGAGLGVAFWQAATGRCWE